jgi:hypothetical protein
MNITTNTTGLIPTAPGKRFVLAVSIGSGGLQGGTLTIVAAATPTDIPLGTDPFTATAGYEITAPTDALRVTLAGATDTVDIRVTVTPVIE